MKTQFLFAVCLTSTLLGHVLAGPEVSGDPKIRRLQDRRVVAVGFRPKGESQQGILHGIVIYKIWKGGDDELKVLTEYPTIRIINILGSEHVSDKTIEALRGVKVRQMTLRNVNVTDQGLAHLPTMIGMEKLRINNIPVTDEGIANLAQMKDLAQLTISGTKVTTDGVKKLQKTMPKCEIRSNVIVNENSMLFFRYKSLFFHDLFQEIDGPDKYTARVQRSVDVEAKALARAEVDRIRQFHPDFLKTWDETSARLSEGESSVATEDRIRESLAAAEAKSVKQTPHIEKLLNLRRRGRLNVIKTELLAHMLDAELKRPAIDE